MRGSETTTEPKDPRADGRLEDVDLNDAKPPDARSQHSASSAASSARDQPKSTHRSTGSASTTEYSRYGREVLWRQHEPAEASTSQFSVEEKPKEEAKKKSRDPFDRPIYTFEEFLQCSPSDDSDDDDERAGRHGGLPRFNAVGSSAAAAARPLSSANAPPVKRKSGAAQPSAQPNGAYDNVALEPDEQHAARPTRSTNPFDEDWPGESNDAPQPPQFGGRWQADGEDRVGFYVLNGRQPQAANRIHSFDQRFRSVLSARSTSSTASTAESSARPPVGQPRVLCASSLTTEPVDEKPPEVDEQAPVDRLHPVLRRPLSSILCDLFACRRCSTATRPSDNPREEAASEESGGMCGKCWRSLTACFSRPGRRSAQRADQYRMADGNAAEEPINKSFQERERPSAANYTFSEATDATLVKRRGDVGGQQFVIANCQNSVLMVLDNLGSVTVDDCKSCVIILGPCSGSVFVRDCSDCTIFTACQQFRTRDCSIMVHLFCATKPIIEETTAQFFPLFLKYPFIEENMIQSGLSPFTNYWHKVHDFTPETSQFTVSSQPKPIENTYGPAHNWLPELKAERVSIDPADSYFLFTPSGRGTASGEEERVLLLFNLPANVEEPTRASFYSTTNSVVHRLCADPAVARLVVAHDLDIREGELGNVLGQKNSISGKLISIELAGPVERCRSFVEQILGPAHYTGIVIQTLPPDKTEVYRQNLNRLADVQCNV
ncbi:Protein XRP2 [Aphelenchoides fujianensis]|nr:Protein XRP2 [Aphelenchoides fujianensis]